MARRKNRGSLGPYLGHVEIVPEWVRDPDAFPHTLPAVRGLGCLTFHPKVTFFVGENGSGKSTVLEAVAGLSDLNPEGGSQNFNFATRESHSRLDRCMRLSRLAMPPDSFFLRAESFYNVASEIERLDKAPGLGGRVIDSYGGNSLHEQSHGESFFALFRERFRGHGLYLLDEPEAALSPMRQMAFLRILDDLVNDCSQFVIATHSPIVLAYPRAWIYELSADGPPRHVTYKQTEHFRVYRDFLNRYPRMLDLLLKGDE